MPRTTKKTEVLKISPSRFGLRHLAPAADVLLGGGVVGAATESFYGLMALADKPEALEKIGTLKGGREEGSAYLLLVDCFDRVKAYAEEIPPETLDVTGRFWPGLLTILFKARAGLNPAILGSKKGTVGIRLDKAAIPKALVRVTDRAVTGTSANPHGEPPAKDAKTLLKYYENRVDLVIDSGPAKGKKPSTVLDLSKAPWTLVREGAVSAKELARAIPLE
ncbi:MAG: threonylcarbamoyl-AMP synthase [Deltaproteobacteria bacterium]|jgi:L-threonylcarbamoyladenylate synthase|nr:threonylcarbamoyl-AMP synthase [Deltaproteobacteria bacterium]